MRLVFLWLVALVLGQLLSFLVVELRAPELPLSVRVGVGLFAGLMLGVVITKTQRDQSSAFDAVRLGDRAQCLALLQKRRAGGTLGQMDAFGTAALEIAVGEVAAARARLAHDIVPIGVAGQLAALVKAHLAVVSGDLPKKGQALQSLLQLGRLPHASVERYGAYLVSCLALSPLGAALLSRADHKLASHADPEARAYLQWLRAHHEVMPFDTHDRREDLHRAAELAMGQGWAALSAKISARAQALWRAEAEMGPYRR